MGKSLGSSASACKEHQWKGLNGVCASCLRDRLIANISTPAAASCYARSQSSTPETYMLAPATDADQRSSTLLDNICFCSSADAALLWQRSNSRGRNSKEFPLCDPKDGDNLCLVYFDADAVDPDRRFHGHEKCYRIVAADSCSRKDGAAADALAAERTECYSQINSSLRMERVRKSSEKKSKAFWTTPSAILRRLFSSSKATSMTHGKTDKHQEFSDDRQLAATATLASLAMGASLQREGAATSGSSVSKSSNSSSEMHPLPLTSTGCYHRITETMRHKDPVHRFSCQSCSTLQPIHHLAANCSKSVRASKVLTPSSKQLGGNMDLEKYFKGAASSWSRSNLVVEQETLRRPSYSNQSPSHDRVLFHPQSSFRSNPRLQTRKCRRRQKSSTHGIFKLLPSYSLGNDPWNCHHLSSAAYKRTSSYLPAKHRLT